MEKNIRYKTFSVFLAGMLGSFILGFLGLLFGVLFGGSNESCPNSIEYLSGASGYEACGSFGATLGWIAGAFLGMIICARKKIVSYRKVSGILFAMVLGIPALFVGMAVYLDYGNGSVEFSEIFSNILLLMGLLAAPSFVAMLLVYVFKFCKNLYEPF